jgi:hypothetical protein
MEIGKICEREVFNYQLCEKEFKVNGFTKKVIVTKIANEPKYHFINRDIEGGDIKFYADFDSFNNLTKRFLSDIFVVDETFLDLYRTNSFKDIVKRLREFKLKNQSEQEKLEIEIEKAQNTINILDEISKFKHDILTTKLVSGEQLKDLLSTLKSEGNNPVFYDDPEKMFEKALIRITDYKNQTGRITTEIYIPLELTSQQYDDIETCAEKEVFPRFYLRYPKPF